MTFQSPIYLLALLAVPASVAIYLLADRRRRAGAARFASPALMPSVAPSGPGFRRHLPLLFYVVALAAVALAMARPEATVAVPEERAAVVLTTDVSGSMEARDVAPSRMTAVRRAALEFLDRAPDELRIGAVAFNHAVRRIEPPRAEREDTRTLIQDLSPSGGTATGEGLAAALGLISRPAERDRSRPPAAVILLSDGASTHGRNPLQVAREASQSDELATVYERLGSQVATREERREVTAAFVGGAAAFLLLGGALSLRWFGRLP
jgi:Ca-activated chloride channel family protein